MTLADYIQSIGLAEFCRRFDIKERTGYSYMLRERLPRREVARKILANSPLTWDDIYRDEPVKPKSPDSGGTPGARADGR